VESHEDVEKLEDQALTGQGKVKSRRMGAAIVLGIVVVFVGGLLTLMMVKPPQKSLCDEAAPDFSVKLFDEYRGGWSTDTVSLANLRGKGVVLNFWASWCKPCEEEAATLESTWKQFQNKGIVFAGIDYLDQEPSAKRYLANFQVSYPNGPDLEGKISQRYAIRGVPETFFIDPEGKLVGCRQVGPIDETELQRRISQIMPK
jgi:cytochrome c biogenesis protein CcmG, thiol:disulfide interchange protein DsbE